MIARSAETRSRLVTVAYRLFAQRGFDDVTVAEVAREAGVSHMTFFRHFPTKESIVVADVFDPLIAECVAEQPVELAPLRRVAGGLLAALGSPEAHQEMEGEVFHSRIRLAAATPSLHGAVWANSIETQRQIVHALTTSGVQFTDAAAAAGAVIGAATAVLLDWAQDPSTTAATALRQGINSLLEHSS